MRWYFIMMILLTTGVTGATAATAQTEPGAYEVYKAFFEGADAGQYARSGYIFFIAEAPIDDKSLPRRHYEGRAMLETARLLKTWLAADLELASLDESRFGPLMHSQIQDMITAADYVDLNLSSVKARILENHPREGKYRYVVAVEEQILTQEKTSLAASVRSMEFFAARVFQRAWRASTHNDLQYLLLEAGLPELALYVRKKDLHTTHSLVNYYTPAHPFQERAILRRLLVNSVSPESHTELLDSLPAAFEILTPLAKSLQTADPLGAMVLTLTALPDTDTARRSASIAFLKQNTARLPMNQAVIKEYSQRLELRVNCSEDSLAGSTVWQATCDARGYLTFAPSLAAESGKTFIQARTFFNQGVRLPEIIQLLLLSIDAAPRHAESWQYLGAALAARQLYTEALIANVQALQLAGSHPVILANLAFCLQELGFRNSARAYAHYIKVVDQTASDPYPRTISQQILNMEN